MSGFSVSFSEWARSSLPSVNWSAASIKMTVLLRSLQVEDGDYLPQGTLEEFLKHPGVQEVSGPFSNTGTSTVSGASTVSGEITTVGSDGFTYVSDAPCFAHGIALSLAGTAHDGALICVMQPPAPLYLTGDEHHPSRITPVAGDSHYIFSFLTAPDEGGCSPQIGDMAAAVPTLRWEHARAAHVWLDPQRVNYAVNPSFETTGDDGKPFGWRSNASMTRERGGIRPPGFTQSRQYCGRLSGPPGSTKVLESQFFPTSMASSWWSVEAAVAASGRVRIGIVFWPPSMDEDDAVYVSSGWFDLASGQEHDPDTGPDDDQIHQGKFRVIKALLPHLETVHEALLRVEFESDGDVWVDNVLVEPNEAQLGYFDGGWEFGQVGDFTWYTGSGAQDVNGPHKTYSMFYNNRRALRGYLLDPPEGEPPPHHVLSWVPEGAMVIAHWDDVFSIRGHSWIDDIYLPIIDHHDKTVVSAPGSEHFPTPPEDP